MNLTIYLPHENYTRDFFWEDLYHLSKFVQTFQDRDDNTENFCDRCQITHSPNLICLPPNIKPDTVDTFLDFVGIPTGNHPYNISWEHHDVLNFIQLCETLQITESWMRCRLTNDLTFKDLFNNYIGYHVLVELTSSNFHETALCLARAIHRLTRRWINTVQNYVNYHRKNEHERQLRELFGSDLDDSL